MGYETNLIFVETYQKTKKAKPKGYMTVLASFDMCKVTQGKMRELNEKAQNNHSEEEEKQLHKEIDEYEQMRENTYNREGNYSEYMEELSESKRDAEIKKLHKLRKSLEKKLPFVFWSNDYECFRDAHGSLLLMVDLEELRQTLEHCRAEDIIKNGEPYRRYELALKMIEEFQSDRWQNDRIKVILWGH